MTSPMLQLGMLIVLNVILHYIYYKISVKNRNLIRNAGIMIVISILFSATVFYFSSFVIPANIQLIYYFIVLGSFLIHCMFDMNLFERWVSGRNIRVNFINSTFLSIGFIWLWYFLLIW
jgi:hypothetical protein